MESARPKIFEVLREADSDAADRAFVEGMPELDSDDQAECVKALLERGRDAGLNAIPVLFDRVDGRSQSRIILGASRLFSSLRSAIRSGKIQTRSNALRIVSKSGNVRLAYIAAHALRDASPQIRTEAGSVLLAMTEAYRRRHADTTAELCESSEAFSDCAHPIARTLDILREEREFLYTALKEGLDGFESHHRLEVVKAAMYLADGLENALFQHMSHRRGKLTHAMLEVFSKATGPHFAQFAYVAMKYKDMRGRIIAMLSTCRDSALFAEMIRYGWMGRDPEIRRALHGMRSLAWFSDQIEAVFSLPAEVAAKLPAWLLPLGLPADEKVSILNHLFMLDDEDAHRAAAWALGTIKSASSTRALNMMLESDNPEIQRIAKFELANRKRNLAHHGDVPAGRPEEWRELLRLARLSEEFDDFLENFERIEPTIARDAGFHAVSHIPGFSTHARVNLLGRKSADRLRALRLVLLLHVSEHFRNEILGLTRDANVEVRSAAMTAIGRVGDPTGRRILERALQDDAPTVVAAAIFGLDQMRAERREELIKPICNSEDPGARAAAIRVLLRMRLNDGATNLIYMLNDPRPRHRSAALWLVDRLQLVTLAERVTEMANGDTNQRVSRTALRVLKRFDRLHEMTKATPVAEKV
ncbi:MAG: HEAT repeat domain-containing protein [Planctomycetota bacterium]|nr:HEAT repeat domain-containing protein [Planctomycetota bacterium]